MDIHVNIDRLVLEGIMVSPGERPLLQAAVESELVRLLTEGGLSWQTGIALPQVPAAPIQLKSENNPTGLSEQIAQAVYGGMNR